MKSCSCDSVFAVVLVCNYGIQDKEQKVLSSVLLLLEASLNYLVCTEGQQVSATALIM